ncbi:hypothetical protein BDY24DRAFT_418326 [Mrakia frigida]|uniref:uncharacterized protein n=1 Tax=Mrakia frigida TaxID=29902 RepID=UPI003FCBFBED
MSLPFSSASQEASLFSPPVSRVGALGSAQLVVVQNPTPPTVLLPPLTPPRSPLLTTVFLGEGTILQSDISAFDREQMFGFGKVEGNASNLFGSAGGEVEEAKEVVRKGLNEAQTNIRSSGASYDAFSDPTSSSKLTSLDVQALLDYTSTHWPYGTLQQRVFLQFLGDADDGTASIPFSLLSQANS